MAKQQKQAEGLVPVYTPEDLTLSGEQTLTTKQLQFLFKATPKDQIYKRPAKGGGTWDYVKGSHVKKVLNLMFGFDWDFIIDDHQFDINVGQAFVKGKLIVRVGDKRIEKHQFGRADIKFKTEWVQDPKYPDNPNKKVKQTTTTPLDIGNDLKAAATDCLKKCASELGLFSDVYSGEENKQIQIMESPEVVEEIKMLMESIPNLDQADIDSINEALDNEDEKQYTKIVYRLRRAFQKYQQTLGEDEAN